MLLNSDSAEPGPSADSSFAQQPGPAHHRIIVSLQMFLSQEGSHVKQEVAGAVPETGEIMGPRPDR